LTKGKNLVTIVIRGGKMKGILGIIFVIGLLLLLLAFMGWWFGKALHDFIAFGVPLQQFKNCSWFDSNQYINLYKQYSRGLDILFSQVFAIVFLGFALIFALEFIAIYLTIARYRRA